MRKLICIMLLGIQTQTLVHAGQNGFDVVGIDFGINPNQVLAAVKKYDASMAAKPKIVYWESKLTGDNTGIREMQFCKKITGNSCDEKIYVFFGKIGQKSYSIQREIRTGKFKPDDVAEGISKKYLVPKEALLKTTRQGTNAEPEDEYMKRFFYWETSDSLAKEVPAPKCYNFFSTSMEPAGYLGNCGEYSGFIEISRNMYDNNIAERYSVALVNNKIITEETNKLVEAEKAEQAEIKSQQLKAIKKPVF